MSQVLSVYSVNSLKMGLISLREHKESLLADDNPIPVRRNGLMLNQESYSVGAGGNGLLTILMRYDWSAKDQNTIEFLDHPTNECTVPFWDIFQHMAFLRLIKDVARVPLNCCA